MNQPAKILVIEDEPKVLGLEQFLLENAGYVVYTATSGEAGLEVARINKPDLVLLDVILPGIDGLRVCQRIRRFSPVPVIMVTAVSNIETTVRCLESGADGYLCKPFHYGELLARISAALRRTSLGSPAEPTIQCGDLVVDMGRNRVTLSGREVILTDTEYRLLCYLAQNAGRIVTQGQIVQRIWGEECQSDSHLLHVTMGRLRQKLDDCGRNSRYIRTVSGIGYGLRLAPTATSGDAAGNKVGTNELILV